MASGARPDPRLARPAAVPVTLQTWSGLSGLAVMSAGIASMDLGGLPGAIGAASGAVVVCGSIGLSVMLGLRNRSLRRRAAVAEAVADLGQQALSVSEPDDLLRAALLVAIDVLKTDYGTALRRLPDGALRVAAEVGIDPLPPGTLLPLAEDRSYALRVVDTARPFTSSDLRVDPRVTPPAPLLDRGIVSGIAVPVLGAAGPLGVLAVHARRRRTFSRDDVATVESLADVVATAWEQAAHRESVEHQALHDPLTGLPNRALFFDRLEQALVHRETDQPAADSHLMVMLLDVDRFKSVNDSLGHPAGDEVLRTIARRFAAAVRPEDTVARLGGDEFALLCDHVTNEKAAVALAQRVLATSAPPLAVEGTMLVVTSSIGLTLTRGRARPRVPMSTMLKEADAALYEAKRNGRGRIEVFDQRTATQAHERVELENELLDAIDHQELTLHYQPIRSTVDQRLIGVEALVRWRHPRRGLLPPADFLPLAERTGAIVPLGRWVLQTACRQIAAWQRAHAQAAREPLHLAVNVSARQLEDAELPGLVETTLRESALAEGTLALELTETALLDGGEKSVGVLTRLRASGAELSLDDFGTGYSSLVHLARFPVSTVKIDRSFVAGLGRDRRNTAIVSAVIALGSELDVRVVAEGVEMNSQLTALKEMRCDAVQGFLLDLPRPLPAMVETPARHLADHVTSRHDF